MYSFSPLPPSSAPNTSPVPSCFPYYTPPPPPPSCLSYRPYCGPPTIPPWQCYREHPEGRELRRDGFWVDGLIWLYRRGDEVVSVRTDPESPTNVWTQPIGTALSTQHYGSVDFQPVSSGNLQHPTVVVELQEAVEDDIDERENGWKEQMQEEEEVKDPEPPYEAEVEEVVSFPVAVKEHHIEIVKPAIDYRNVPVKKSWKGATEKDNGAAKEDGKGWKQRGEKCTKGKGRKAREAMETIYKDDNPSDMTAKLGDMARMHYKTARRKPVCNVDGSWSCRRCQNANLPRRKVCNKCTQKRNEADDKIIHEYNALHFPLYSAWRDHSLNLTYFAFLETFDPKYTEAIKLWRRREHVHTPFAIFLKGLKIEGKAVTSLSPEKVEFEQRPQQTEESEEEEKEEEEEACDGLLPYSLPNDDDDDDVDEQSEFGDVEVCDEIEMNDSEMHMKTFGRHQRIMSV